ncbi:MAG: hypothetical protein CMF31_02155 [Kordiimonas sp.]|nr:hypothetical protein [Kordiimonas sp.]|tara:strand:+ start:841 stop:1545 length:705 start_codon:yes stop_codon:yes gene_type:complete
MCGRYALVDDLKKVLAGLPVDMVPDLPACYNLAPGMPIPVLIYNRQQQLTTDLMQWGLVPHWSKDLAQAPKPINARSETAAQKPAFRGPWRQHRGLVPASGFYEWQNRRATGKQPHFISRHDKQPLFFAALWDEWAAPSGEILLSCTILTCPANQTLKPLHARMPVMITPDQFDSWLSPAARPKHLQAMMRPADDDILQARPVSTYVNNVRHDDPGCLAQPEPTIPFPEQGSLF